jgi:predicted nuclease with RNAse H fold
LPSFAGIDLTSSPNKPSAYALLGVDLRILSLQFLYTDSDIIAAVEYAQPALIAIDAPLSLPRGLCCLNEDCLCHPASSGKGRLCERELASMRISCYFTMKRSIIKKMVYRAIDLRKELAARGLEEIEVYPYASKVAMWGKPIPKKTSAEGLEYLKVHLTSIIPDLAQHKAKLDHDLCDAIIAAYTAYLHNHGKSEPIGDHDEGPIYVPCPHPGFPV